MDYLHTKLVKVIRRTFEYMERTGRMSTERNFAYLQYLLSHDSKPAETAETCEQKQRYEYILSKLSQGRNESLVSTLLDLSLAAAIVPEFEAYLKYYTGYAATASLACEIEGYPDTDYQYILELLQDIQCVCFVDWNEPLLPFATVSVDDQLAAFILSNAVQDKGYGKTAQWFRDWESVHPFFVREQTAQKGLEILRAGNILQLSGDDGKRFIAKHIAMDAERNLLLCDFERLMQLEKDRKKHVFGKLMHGAFIYGGIYCIHGINEIHLKDVGATEYFYSEYVEPLSDNGIPVILCTDQSVTFKSETVSKIEIPTLGRPDREAVWRGFAKLYDLKLDAVGHSIHYKLSASEISSAVTMYRNSNDSPEWSKVCFEILSHKYKVQLGEVIYPQIRMEDLELEDKNKAVLEQALYYAKYSHLIYEDEKLDHIYAYGRALTILLNGPSGTGKTMTAHAFANALGVALYHVDLSQIADKYVGETEKHLEQVFNYAERMPMVLFFDEADAIFGKRTEVSDGHARYNNMNVSYILQRIEHFEGTVILATNLKNNIDAAFMRRMKYIIQYDMPNADMRRRIWESCLPDENGLTEDELKDIAEHLDLSGGDIKNVVITACIIAKSCSETLKIKHIAQAVAQEYKKKGRLLSDLGSLRIYL